MALRNAFGELATEFSLRKLIDQMRFARDGNDRLRVIVDSAPQVTIFVNNTSAGISGQPTPAPFSASTWNLNDARHEMQELSLQTFQVTRNRWTIT